MPQKKSLIVRLVRSVITLLIAVGCFGVFLFTPFYSKIILCVLQHVVPIHVNAVAAKSQQLAALSEHDDLEPGSNLWLARQAYLTVLQEASKNGDVGSLNHIEMRYQHLESEIEKNDNDQSLENNKADTLQKYMKFLTHIPSKNAVSEPVSQQVHDDLEQAKAQPDEKKFDAEQPSAIVVLGGGLTSNSNHQIVVNSYTRLRLEKTLEIEKNNKLPILLSGVEAPYMQTWLKQYGVDAKLLENKSMNTCENSRFSSLLLQKKGGAPKVILITDEYHMPRTRRLFATNGITTVPVSAPIPSELTQWKPALQNYDHSRRANYELLASIRDVVIGTSDCREVP